MGKTAENEKLKLTAAFYNNLATGFVITGYAVPYFAFMQKTFEEPLDESLIGMLLASLNSREVWVLSAIGLWVIVIAWLLRRIANRTIAQIDDD